MKDSSFAVNLLMMQHMILPSYSKQGLLMLHTNGVHALFIAYSYCCISKQLALLNKVNIHLPVGCALSD